MWSRDGRELFFLDPAFRMTVVPVLPGPNFRVGDPQVLFDASGFLLQHFFRQFDVTPDGRRFEMIKGESDNRAHVVVVINFLEELKRIMASP
jgi:hypothetical protein